MDELDLDDLNFRELYKLHTTGALNSDSSASSDSDSITSSSSLERNNPLLYTFEEINANLVVIEAKNSEKECSIPKAKIPEVVKVVEKPSEESLQKKLENLILPDYCYICCADLGQPGNANSHYNSKRHKYNVEQWKEEESRKSGEIWQEKLKRLTLPDYCYVCSADLWDPNNADSHYRSKRHRTLVEQWKAGYIESQVVNKTQSNGSDSDKCKTAVAAKQNQVQPKNCAIIQLHVNPLCTVCGISVGSSLQDHDKSDIHRRSMELFCLVCKVKCTSKEHLSEHVKSSGHEDNLKSKISTSSNLTVAQKIIKSPVKNDARSINASSTENVSKKNKMCSICNIQLGNDSVVQEHYKSLVHERNLKKQELSKSRWCFCVRCKLPLDGTEKAEDHYEDPDHIMKNISSYCHICKVKFASRTEMNNHVNSFPHIVVSKLKSVLVSKGISTQEFWRFNRSEIYCYLCKVIMENQSTADDHFQSKGHYINFKTWCLEQPQDSKDLDIRWYFCILCNELLDGTTNIELHYQGKRHAEQHKKQSTVDQIDISSKPNTITEIAKEESKKINSVVEDPQNKNEIVDKMVNGFENNIRNENNSSNDKKAAVNPKTYYCYVCKLSFNSRSEVTSHSNTYTHQYAAKFKAELVSKGITNSIFWHFESWNILCKLCNASIECQSSADGHFNCLRHKQRYETWCIKQTKGVKDPDSKWHFCNVCNISLDGTTNSEDHYQENGHVINDRFLSSTSLASNITHDTIERNNGDLDSNDTSKAESIGSIEDSQSNTENDNESITLFQKLPFSCYLCKRDFNSQTELKLHNKSFEHSCIYKLKVFLVSKGISKKEYWEHKGLFIWCRLCEAVLYNRSCANDHLSTKKHVNKLVAWCNLQLQLNKDICKESLDGTSNADDHFLGKSHIEKENEYKLLVPSSSGTETNILNKDVTNVSSPQDSIENADTSNNFNKLSSLDTISDDDEDQNSSQKIIQSEMEKLLVKMKGIPLGKALNILKKLNEEFENVDNTSESVNNTSESVDNTSESQPLIVEANENIYSENNLESDSGRNQFGEEKEKENYFPNNPSYFSFKMLLWGAAALLFLHLLRK